MKSHATFLADFRQAEFPKVIDLTCPEAHMQKELRNLTRSKKWTETPETIENGDAVTLALASGLPRFNRSMVPVTVGDGLYDAELEVQLLGHGVGDTFTATVQGKDVSVTVKRATRSVFPEPTDEMVEEYAPSREGMENVKTVADFRRRVEEQYREGRRQDALYGGIVTSLNYVLDNSDWAYDDEEVSSLCEAQRTGLRQAAASEGKDFDTMTDEEFYRMFDVESRTQMEILIRKDAETSLAQAYWVGINHGVDPAASSLEDLRQLGLGFLQDFVKSQLRFEN